MQFGFWLIVFVVEIGLQVQQSWAYAHNVNLLAAGYSDPGDGYSGSGIYSGHNGALNAVISDTPLTKLLVAYVPKVPGTILPRVISSKDKSTKHHGVASNPAMIFSEENLPDLDFLMLNFTASNRQEGKICKNDFCCHVKCFSIIHKFQWPHTFEFECYCSHFCFSFSFSFSLQYAIEVFTHKLPANAVSIHRHWLSAIRQNWMSEIYFEWNFNRFSHFIRTPLPCTTAWSHLSRTQRPLFMVRCAVWWRAPTKIRANSSTQDTQPLNLFIVFPFYWELKISLRKKRK